MKEKSNKPVYVQRSVRLPVEVYEKLAELADKDCRSFNKFMTIIIKDYLRRNEIDV